MLIELMAKNNEIPPSDWLWVKFRLEDGMDYVGVFKLNHSQSYTHFVSYEQEQLKNELIMHQSILPTAQPAIDEGAVLECETVRYQFIEKKHHLSTETQANYYFSAFFLKVPPATSINEALKEIKQAVEETAKDFKDPVYEALAKAKTLLYQEMSQEEGFSNERLANQLYTDNITQKSSYMNRLSQIDLSELEQTKSFPMMSHKMQRQ
ncbi:nucleoid-associated protein [Aerococcus christensenii]|uniref:nucleoid-associated protein n=1 Tax=Aerococcus christensenii TaxID=87541 RepID=UPI0023A9E18E|nr:nucleoid-associated protein [Aerococcus christensenii]WEB70343.1 nucleoid-associated protein [Aerococcus christensenii]